MIGLQDAILSSTVQSEQSQVAPLGWATASDEGAVLSVPDTSANTILLNSLLRPWTPYRYLARDDNMLPFRRWLELRCTH